jgi:hypothetical protein
MRIRAGFLAALMLVPPVEAQAPSAADDTSRVIGAVLVQEAAVRGPELAAETCVSPTLAGMPIAPGGDDPMAPPGAVRIRMQWHAVPAPPTRATYVPPEPGSRRRHRRRTAPPPPPPTPLAEDAAARLNSLWQQATAEAATAGPVGTMIRAAMPRPLHIQRPDEDCALLTLSVPVFAGAAAFIETAYQCASTCGNGTLYALERRDGGWEIVGVADTWIR